MPEALTRFLPFYARHGLFAIDSGAATPEAIAVALTRPEDALVFAVYTTVALVVGTMQPYRRDTN